MNPQSGCDACKPFREVFNSSVKTIASSKLFTSILTTIPIISMIAALIYFETSLNAIVFDNTTYEISTYKYVILSPVIVVSSLTFIFGSAALLAIKFQFQNLLGFSSFVYASIAYWAIINILIITFCMVPYFSMLTIGKVLAWSIISSVIWLFTSAVMDAHRQLVNDTIVPSSLEVNLV